MFSNQFGNHENVCCGLVWNIKQENAWRPPVKAPIPLVSVNVNASVVHAVAQVEVTQVYVNKEETPIEAVYYFPVNPDGAVTHFQAELEGRVIKGNVKPKEEAKKVYDKAVKNQQTAFLGEETKADIFKLRVGFLQPGTKVKVIIGYVTEVKNDPGSNAIRFYIPTTIAPRYVSASETDTSDTDEEAEDIKAMTFSEQSPAPISINVAVSLQGGIKSIESPTHQVKVTQNEKIPENEAWHKALVELSTESTDIDRDFVLNIIPDDVHRSRLYCEKVERVNTNGGSSSTAMMVHLVPSFKLDEQKTELIFVLDRSGSMEGQSIGLAKKALLLFLHSMPADCYFNVVGFGSTFEFLYPKSVKYDDGSLEKAIKHAKTLQADLGGTEILEPLKKIYGKPGIEGYLRQIFILTDGEVSDTDGVIGIAKANAHKARVFALGIGEGASHHLVEGVAKSGGGTSAFVTYKESLDKKVLNQLKNALQPSLTDIELIWEGVTIPPVAVAVKPNVVVNKEKTLLGYGKPMETDAADGCATPAQYPQQSPNRIPPVYDGSQLLVFGLFRGDEIPSGVTIKAQSPDGPLSVKIDYSPSNSVGSTGMLHRLAAIKLVRELEVETASLDHQALSKTKLNEEEERLKKAIVGVACENGVTSRYTSFVAVDVNPDGKDKASSEIWVMETRNVPSQLPIGGGSPIMRRSVPAMRRGGGAVRKCASYVGGPVVRRCSSASTSSVKRNRLPAKRCATSTAAPAAKRAKDDSSSESTESESDEDDVEETGTSTGTPLEQLISLQSFDGSFQLTEKLASLLELKQGLKQLKQSATRSKLAADVFATALAISYFVGKLADEKDVWELVVTKAKKWLAAKVNKDKVDGILKKPADYLQ